MTRQRTPFIAGNWKMHLTPAEAAVFAQRFIAAAERAFPQTFVSEHVEVVIAPAMPLLDRLAQALGNSGVALAAQNVHDQSQGAFTGETSISMLEALGCRYALIGHSERRQLFGETDAFIAAKAASLLPSRVAPLLCVGETLQERESGTTFDVVGRQMAAVLDLCLAEKTCNGFLDRLVVAYEPVWAIGTGKTATPEMAQTVHAAIRKLLIERLGDVGHTTRILYGGSVKPSNARDLLSQTEIDGALVGGASLEPDDFAEIVFAGLETSAKMNRQE